MTCTSWFLDDARTAACALSFSWTSDPTTMAWSRLVALNSWTVLAAAREWAAFLASDSCGARRWPDPWRDALRLTRLGQCRPEIRNGYLVHLEL